MLLWNRFFNVCLVTAVVALVLATASCSGIASAHAAQTLLRDLPSQPASGPVSAPASAITIDNIDDDPAWLTCGGCGDNGGSGPSPTYSISTGIGSPSEDGASAQFAIATTVPLMNGYAWVEHPAIESQINGLVYQFDIYIPNGMQHAPQAIEFECQQQLGGWFYNFAWQADYSEGQWRTFDYGAQQWDATSVPFSPLTPGKWHRILGEFHDDIAHHTITHDALTIDGTRYPVGVAHNAAHTGDPTDKFTNAFQLDTNAAGTPFGVFVDGMKVTYW